MKGGSEVTAIKSSVCGRSPMAGGAVVQQRVSQADVAGADRAAELAKCDLVTEMVREFTELQGVVGGLYARAQGEPEEIAWAVYDQYKPIGLDDPIPRNLTGCAVALADKLDSLVACFAVGAIPTGSSDPFALRRAALGIVKIILERKLPLSISAAISAAAKNLGEQTPRIESSESSQKQVLEFLLERAQVHPARAARLRVRRNQCRIRRWRGRSSGCGGPGIGAQGHPSV